MRAAFAWAVWMAGLVGLLANGPGAAGFSASQLLPATERSLQIRPKTIYRGQSAVLSWSNPNTSEILLQQAAEADGRSPAEHLHFVGRFPSRGSLEVWPRASTTYVVSCADARTTCAESISVTVR